MDEWTIVRVDVRGPRPGSGPGWSFEARAPNGAIVASSYGPRDVVLAALAEFVEELHEVRT